MSKRWLLSLTVAVVLIGGAQLVPVHRTNPPVTAPLRAPAEIAAMIERSCSDCHSNATRWPWYSQVAPVSWLVGHDVNEGRQNLNFSYWGHLSPADQRAAAKAVTEQLAARAMPIRKYLLLHPRARLSEADRSALRTWFAGPGTVPQIDSLATNPGGEDDGSGF